MLDIWVALCCRMIAIDYSDGPYCSFTRVVAVFDMRKSVCALVSRTDLWIFGDN